MTVWPFTKKASGLAVVIVHGFSPGRGGRVNRHLPPPSPGSSKSLRVALIFGSSLMDCDAGFGSVLVRDFCHIIPHPKDRGHVATKCIYSCFTGWARGRPPRTQTETDSGQASISHLKPTGSLFGGPRGGLGLRISVSSEQILNDHQNVYILSFLRYPVPLGVLVSQDCRSKYHTLNLQPTLTRAPSGGERSEIKVSLRLVPAESESVRGPLPAPGAAGVPCLVDGILPVYLHLQMSPFIGRQSYWTRVRTNDLILSWPSAKVLFPNKVPFTGTGG